MLPTATTKRSSQDEPQQRGASEEIAGEEIERLAEQ
ncbi:hypothetical protein GME_10161 [Halomonas sp. TD01]|nr:hypothetical protein GME_10161 [Halomonas sp. TD01]